MLPAHGYPVGSVQERAQELVRHHDERLSGILELVADGHGTAMEVATALPWTRHRRHLGQLDVVHQMTAVLEVDAHLVVLVERGLVGVASEGGVRRYAPTA